MKKILLLLLTSCSISVIENEGGNVHEETKQEVTTKADVTPKLFSLF
jgi:hypothetical protein